MVKEEYKSIYEHPMAISYYKEDELKLKIKQWI